MTSLYVSALKASLPMYAMAGLSECKPFPGLSR
ncbi:hypothetical protein QF000_002496 [Paraburkholderia atlantica]